MKDLGKVLVLAAVFAPAAPAFAEKDLKATNAEILQEMMGMMRETMSMLARMDEKPSAEEKKRLEQMVQQLNAMMSSHRHLISSVDKWSRTP